MTKPNPLETIGDPEPEPESVPEPEPETRHTTAESPGSDDNYAMNRTFRGKAVIFNNVNFEVRGLEQRDGSEKDMETLKETLKCLGFHDEDIDIKNDSTHHEITECLKTLSSVEQDYTDYDCLIITVMSHGMADGWIFARDTAYPEETLWKSFMAENPDDRNKSLVGKPKIFFIQACRGDKFDAGVNLRSARSCNVRTSGERAEVPDAAPISYTIPSHADFIIAHASCMDKVSVRHPVNGTWFIQSLCREMQKNWTSVDLLDMLTHTVRSVACDHESKRKVPRWKKWLACCLKLEEISRWKQAPTITSTLTRNLYFPPHPAGVQNLK